MPYRQDVDALQSRCDTLEKELEDLRARSRELGDVLRDEARVARELEASRKMLGDKRALPLLDNVRVASPCKASWDEMTGDEKVRFCGQCEKNVYNLSAMGHAEGERLLQEKEGKACVRFYRRADGTVMTTDCPVGVKRKRIRRVAVATVGGGLMAVAGVFGMSAMGRPVAMQGAIAGPTMGEPVMGQMPQVDPAPPPPPATTAVTGHVTMGRPAAHPQPARR